MFASGFINTALLLAALWLCHFNALAQSNPPAAKDPSPTESKSRGKSPDKRKEGARKLSPEERDAKRAELKTRLEKRLAELRAKQTNSSITSAEQLKLDRCEQILKRFEAEASKSRTANQKPRGNDIPKGRAGEQGSPAAR